MSQRNSHADDDIFFDMDGLDTRDSNMPQMTQSDDEIDDEDEDFGRDQRLFDRLPFQLRQTDLNFFCHFRRVICESKRWN